MRLDFTDEKLATNANMITEDNEEAIQELPRKPKNELELSNISES
jgi:hypothetical protein